MDKFVSGKARPRKYRNRRIGEFFKEIDLSEKAATGISKILSELKRNGSPKPEFETDDSRAYLETTISIHDGFMASDKNGINSGVGDDLTVGMSDKMSDKMTEQEQRRIKIIIENMSENGISSKEAAEILGVEQKTANRLLSKAVTSGILEGIGGNRNRRYIISDFKRG